MFRADVVRDIPLQSRGFEFEPEITSKILKRGYRIYEVPISYNGREFEEGKKLNPWREGPKALYYLVKYRFRRLGLGRPGHEGGSQNNAMPSPYRYWVVAACWLGAVFATDPCLPITSTPTKPCLPSWARQIAVWRDPLLLTQPVDKPPLLFYLQAAILPASSARWSGRRDCPTSSSRCCWCRYLALLAWRLYGDGLTAVLAAVLLALSPLAIQFSATAFTDPLLTFWLVVAWWR